MPEAWIKATTLAAALLCCTCGLAWLAIAMETHWQQVRGDAAAGRATLVALRMLGMAALGVALALCLRADHPTMAALAWVMLVAAAALIVAFTLSWRPRWLAPLVAWARPRP